MKLRILSDLHLEFQDWTPPPADCDLVVLAGDIATGDAGMQWAERTFSTPVVYVPGNHEFYGRDFDEPRFQHGDVALLQGGELNLPGVRILGATLWTDFAICGNPDDAMTRAAGVMYDYRGIRRAGRMLRPADTLVRHRIERMWLGEALARPYDGKTVVVSHHCPSAGSIPDRFRGNPVNGAFASDLAELAEQADLWVHGHTHTSFDYRIGKCRVVCNPRGYPVNGGNENADFNPTLVVEI
jgi:predicted phosphodiesterase